MTTRTRKPARTRVAPPVQAAEPEIAAPEKVADEAPAPTPVPEKVAAPVAAAPKVVTRTRRSASRPAGTPVSTSSEPVEPIQVPIAVPIAAASAASAEPDGAAPAAPAEPPKVITRTRGRSASRAAGPPEAAEGEGDTPEATEAPTVEHVPVKKKGTRKR